MLPERNLGNYASGDDDGVDDAGDGGGGDGEARMILY